MKVEKKNGFTRNRSNTKNDNGIKTLSTSKIKKKIRDTQRTLKNDKISASVLVDSKRKLKALQVELAESLINDQEKAMSTKYHKTRFIEKKKAHRKLKKAKSNLEKNPDDPSKKEKLKEAELNVLYIEHYPRSLPYVSLYPVEENQANEATFAIKRESIKKRMREAMENGDSDFKLMKRSYRDEYKNKLIQQGKLEDITVDEDENVEETTKDNGDDFFE